LQTNSCIGYFTSLHFAILACRTLEEIKAVAGPQAKVEYMLCDVSSFKYADHIVFITSGSITCCQFASNAHEFAAAKSSQQCSVHTVSLGSIPLLHHSQSVYKSPADPLGSSQRSTSRGSIHPCAAQQCRHTVSQGQAWCQNLTLSPCICSTYINLCFAR